MSELNVPVKGISRRSFLKTTAAVAGAAAVSGATMTALAATDEETATDDEHEVVCVCGCNCQGNCSMVATVREGKMVNIRSNENLPYPAYERICMRGFSHANRMYDFNRVLYPMKRKTWSLEEPHVENRGNDEWERLSWDEATQLVADTLTYNTENYGVRSNCVLVSAGNSFAAYGGLIAGLAIGKITEYFCSDKYKPVHKIADAADTGAATVIIEGIGTGMLSTIAPIVLVALAIIGAYTFGNMAFPNAAADGGIAVGLFGVGLAATGMLSNTAITIGVDAYGPVADNAGGIAEMAGLPEEVRDRTDALDAVGNTTAAIAKGFAIASAGLSAISLFVSYQATMHHSIPDFALTLTDPLIVAGIFIGAMMPFMFAALTMGAVSRAAHAMVEEVRRQFREIKGIMEYKAEPEYDKCVAISTSSALREMMLPGCLAIVVPVAIGCFNPAMLGGFLAGAVATGMLMAIFMSNAGGAWDNAKKYIEQGHHGGKGSEAHKAAVVGDTVGDPFKDTSGPSMNILINLMTIVSLTFAPLFIMLQGMF